MDGGKSESQHPPCCHSTPPTLAVTCWLLLTDHWVIPSTIKFDVNTVYQINWRLYNIRSIEKCFAQVYMFIGLIRLIFSTWIEWPNFLWYVRSNSNSPRAVSLFRSVQVGVLFQTFFAQEQFDEMKRKGELLNVYKPNWNICQKETQGGGLAIKCNDAHLNKRDILWYTSLSALILFHQCTHMWVAAYLFLLFGSTCAVVV
jgi:hypothetical protein